MYTVLLVVALSVMVIVAVYRYYRGLDRLDQTDSDFRDDGHFHLIL